MNYFLQILKIKVKLVLQIFLMIYNSLFTDLNPNFFTDF